MIAATDWTVPLAVVCLAALVAVAAWQVHRFHRTSGVAPRLAARIPASERRLLGDDWRECVADYFREGFIRSTRTRVAIYTVTGADPYKSESRDWARPSIPA